MSQLSVLSLIVVTRYIKTTNIRIRIRKKILLGTIGQKGQNYLEEENLIVPGALLLFLRIILSRFVLSVRT